MNENVLIALALDHYVSMLRSELNISKSGLLTASMTPILTRLDELRNTYEERSLTSAEAK